MSPEEETPLASATDDFYHAQYPTVLAHLQQYPVLVLVSELSGIGRSHMLRQAAEQLVQGTQIVFLNQVYRSSGIDPSLLHAYKEGGIVVLTKAYEENFVLAAAILSNQNLLPLNDPRRADRHDDFRLVIECTRDTFLQVNQMSMLSALTVSVQHDEALFTSLVGQVYSTKAETAALLKLVQLLPVAQQYSLHLLRLLATATERAPLIAAMLRENRAVTDEMLQQAGAPLTVIRKRDEAGTTKKAKATTRATVKETDSAQAQQAHLQQIAERAPTIEPNVQDLLDTLPPVPEVDTLPPPPVADNSEFEPDGATAAATADDDEDYGY